MSRVKKAIFQSVKDQLDWIVECGLTRREYLESYGTSETPKGQGMGGDAIYNADVTELQRRIALLQGLL